MIGQLQRRMHRMFRSICPHRIRCRKTSCLGKQVDVPFACGAKSSGPAERLSLAAELPNLQAGRGAAVAFALRRSLPKLRSMTIIIVRSRATISLIFGQTSNFSCPNPSHHPR
jgi:hypothetical protein